MVELYEHQEKALKRLKSGSILCGGVGSGKSLTSLVYFYRVVCSYWKTPKDLLIITTAQKRDTLEWHKECANIGLYPGETEHGVSVAVDSWNNIAKYKDFKDGFVIFDEQKVGGSGPWARTFIKIARANQWLLLSATPGDTWIDYASVFIANGFYKNRTDFEYKHVIYSPFTHYRRIERYVGCQELVRHKRDITVMMDFERTVTYHPEYILTTYDKSLYEKVARDRWNIFKEEPIRDASEYSAALRKIVNSSPARIDAVEEIFENHKRLIIFYNFNYELDMLRNFAADLDIPFAEWNGQKHQPIPKTKEWLYFVQYYAGAEGWNCIETDTIIFFSQHYSYKTMRQAAGRIDRLTTPFEHLYYYILASNSTIDNRIKHILEVKEDFNEKDFYANY